MASARPDPSASCTLAISNLVVRLLSEYTGRGATQARTHFTENLITVVVHDLLTKASAASSATAGRTLCSKPEGPTGTRCVMT
jgi:uncharacterized protein YbcI